MNETKGPGRGYEHSDLSFRAIGTSGAILLGVLVLVSVVLWFSSRAALEGVPPPAAFPPVSVALGPDEAPALQVTPANDLTRLRAREEALLGGYGWIDREDGIAHIPIERAMEILAQEGRAPGSRERNGGRNDGREE